MQAPLENLVQEMGVVVVQQTQGQVAQAEFLLEAAAVEAAMVFPQAQAEQAVEAR